MHKTSSEMRSYLVEPRNILTFSCAQDLSGGSGQITTSIFPRTSAIAGAFRARWFAQQLVNGENDRAKLSTQAEKIRFNGVYYASNKDSLQIALPIPYDAVHFKIDRQQCLLPLEPQTHKLTGVLQNIFSTATSLPCEFFQQSQANRTIEPVRPEADLWSMSSLFRWLSGDSRIDSLGQINKHDLGLNEATEFRYPPVESRIHIEKDRSTQNAVKGMLFSEQGLAFNPVLQDDLDNRDRKHKSSHDAVNSMVVVGDIDINSGSQRFGGRRGRAIITPIQSPIPKHLPSNWMQTILRTRCFRLYLATPGIFENNQGPVIPGCEMLTMASGALVPNHSWDMRNGRARQLQYSVPAGTVYWYKVDEKTTEPDLKDTLSKLWFKSCSDLGKPISDGSAISIIGPWVQNQNRGA